MELLELLKLDYSRAHFKMEEENKNKQEEAEQEAVEESQETPVEDAE